MFPAYVNYTSNNVTNTIRKHGFNKFAQMHFRLQGIDVPEMTEKTAGQIANSCLTTHFLTKKYLKSSIDDLTQVLR